MTHRSTHVSAALALLMLCAAGCLEELPAPSKVVSLRTLAISATPPEVSPGATVTLSALAVDYPAQRPIEYRWAACLLPERAAGFFGGSTAPNSGGGGYGLQEAGNCVALADAGAPGAVDLGTSVTAQLPIAADFFDDLNVVKQAYGLPTDVDIPDALIAGLLAIAGMNLTVTLEVTAGDDRIVSYKRVNVSLAVGEAANRNPSGAAFYLYRTDDEESVDIPTTASVPPGNRCFVGEDGLSDLTIGAGTYAIAPVNIPDPPVTYQVILPALNPEVPFELIDTTETLFHSFFSTEGAFDRDIVKATTTTRGEWLVSETPQEPVPVWIVTRDGRGGASWCHSTLQPEPAP